MPRIDFAAVYARGLEGAKAFYEKYFCVASATISTTPPPGCAPTSLALRAQHVWKS